MNSNSKERLDILLVSRGLAPSREKAKAIIMAGDVYVNENKMYKPGSQISKDSDITVKTNTPAFVSRGGYKLDKALKAFDISLDGGVCVDMGASTGGFTDCMLKNGAQKVYAIDVGYGQLDYGLRTDDRVICIERTNIRTMDISIIKDKVDFISIDVSFISLSLILPVAKKMLKWSGSIVCLVKPQFEAGREQVGKKGIVKDENIHRNVIMKTIEQANINKLSALNLSFSPIRGAKGNIEYLLFLKNDYIHNKGKITAEKIQNTVKQAHVELD